jgi:hypothetical protein
MRAALIAFAVLGTTACVQPQWPMNTGSPPVAPAADSTAHTKAAPADTIPLPLQFSPARAP